MIESLIRFFLEYDHPPSGSTLRLAAAAGDLRGDEQRSRWATARLEAVWRQRRWNLISRQMAWRRGRR